MGLSTIEKIGIGIAGIYAGSLLFPNTAFSATGGLLGTEAASIGGAVQGGSGIPGLQGGTALVGGDIASAAATGGFQQQLIDGFTSPAGIAGLFTAGSSLATTLIGQKEKDKDREALDNRQDKTISATAEQNLLNREHNALEAEKNRSFQAAQAKSAEEFRAEQERKARIFQAAIQAQNQRSAAINSRLSGGGRGSQLAANVSNINQSLLS